MENRNLRSCQEYHELQETKHQSDLTRINSKSRTTTNMEKEVKEQTKQVNMNTTVEKNLRTLGSKYYFITRMKCKQTNKVIYTVTYSTSNFFQKVYSTIMKFSIWLKWISPLLRSKGVFYSFPTPWWLNITTGNTNITNINQRN